MFAPGRRAARRDDADETAAAARVGAGGGPAYLEVPTDLLAPRRGLPGPAGRARAATSTPATTDPYRSIDAAERR